MLSTITARVTCCTGMPRPCYAFVPKINVFGRHPRILFLFYRSAYSLETCSVLQLFGRLVLAAHTRRCCWTGGGAGQRSRKIPEILPENAIISGHLSQALANGAVATDVVVGL